MHVERAGPSLFIGSRSLVEVHIELAGGLRDDALGVVDGDEYALRPTARFAKLPPKAIPYPKKEYPRENHRE
jgi:hypothetical protein